MIAFDRAVQSATDGYEAHCDIEDYCNSYAMQYALRVALETLAQDEEILHVAADAIAKTDKAFAPPCMVLEREHAEAYAKAALAALAGIGK